MACPDPGLKPGLNRNGTIELGKTVVYSCLKPGYQLFGDRNRTCVYLGEKNGTAWTGNIPTCKGENLMDVYFICDFKFLNFVVCGIYCQ